MRLVDVTLSETQVVTKELQEGTVLHGSIFVRPHLTGQLQIELCQMIE